MSLVTKNASAAFAKSIAAEGGLFALIASTDPTGIVTVAQGLKLLGELIDGLNALTKEISEEKRRSADAEQTIRELFKLLALETYAAAMKERLQYSTNFRLKVVKKIEAGVNGLPECSVTGSANLASRAAPVFDYLDRQLTRLLAGDEPSTATQQKFVAEVRQEAERKVTFTAGTDRYQQLVHYLQIVGLEHISTGSGSVARALPVDALIEDNPSPPPSPIGEIPAASPSVIGAKVTEPSPALSGKLRDMFQARFDAARKSVDDGSNIQGQSQFESIVRDLRHLSEPGLEDLLARSLHNWGVALHNMRRDEDAAKCFRDVLEVPGGAARVPLSRFFASYCIGDLPNAKLALASITIPEEQRRHLEAECLIREGNSTEALRILESSGTPEGFLLRVHANCELKRFDKAVDEARSGLAKWPDSLSLLSGLAYSQARPEIDRLQAERGTRRLPDSKASAILLEALGLFKRVREKAESLGQYRLLSEALTWLGLISIALRKEPDAISYLDEALARWPSDEDLWANKHYAHLRADDFSGARKAAQEIAKLNWREGIARETATLICAKNYPEALLVSRKAINQSPELPYIDSRFATQFIKALASASTPEETKEWIAKLAKPSDAPVILLTGCAETLSELGDDPGAELLYSRAEKIAVGLDADLVRVSRGLTYFDRREWALSIRCLGRDGLDPSEGHFSDEILWCLVQLNDLPGAISLGRRMEARGTLTDRGQRSLLAAFSKHHDDPEAEKYASRLIESPNALPRDYLNLFELRRRLKPLSEAIDVLEKGAKAFPHSVEIRAVLSQIYALSGNWKKSLAEARRVSVMAPGTEAERVVWARYAVSKMPDGLLSKEERERVGISFASDKRLTPLRLENEAGEFDPSQLVEMLKKQAEHGKKVMDLCEPNRLPGSFAASLLGLSVWAYWWRIAHGGPHRWWMAHGDSAEQASENAAAASAKTVVIDYSALCTLAALDKLSLLPALFDGIIVSAETRQVFVDELQALEATPPSSGTACYHEGRLVFIDADKSEYERMRKHLRDILDFLGNPLVTTSAPSAEVWSDFKKEVETAGEKPVFNGGVVTAALTAKTHGVPLYSDEAVVRLLFRKEVGVSCFCTQAVVRLARSRKIAADEDETNERLLNLNYYFVSVSEGFLTQHLARNRYAKTRVAERLIQDLPTTKFPRNPGFLELGKIAGVLWFHSESWPRSDWTSMLRDVLNRNRDSQEIYWFAAGIALELRWFPSVVFAIIRHFSADPLLSAEAKSGIRMGFGVAVRTLRDTDIFSPAINAAWRKTRAWADPLQGMR